MMQLRIAVGLTVALLVTFITPYVARGVTIGAPLVDRAGTDSAVGGIYALNSGFPQPGLLTDWAFYNDNFPGQSGLVVTPLLLEIVGGNYLIAGVGTSRTNLAIGVQSFSFGLTSGSAVVGPGVLFGWKDGTDADSSQTGVIEFDLIGSTAAGTQQFFGGGHTGDLFPGSNLGGGLLLGADVGQPNRDYSVQATATAVPEPGTLTLFGLGTLGLLGYGWRQRNLKQGVVRDTGNFSVVRLSQ